MGSCFHTLLGSDGASCNRSCFVFLHSSTLILALVDLLLPFLDLDLFKPCLVRVGTTLVDPCWGEMGEMVLARDSAVSCWVEVDPVPRTLVEVEHASSS